MSESMFLGVLLHFFSETSGVHLCLEEETLKLFVWFGWPNDDQYCRLRLGWRVWIPSCLDSQWNQAGVSPGSSAVGFSSLDESIPSFHKWGMSVKGHPNFRCLNQRENRIMYVPAHLRCYAAGSVPNSRTEHFSIWCVSPVHIPHWPCSLLPML